MPLADAAAGNQASLIPQNGNGASIYGVRKGLFGRLAELERHDGLKGTTWRSSWLLRLDGTSWRCHMPPKSFDNGI